MDKRPVNLDLATVKFPITAIASITHRVTGVVLLGAVLVLLWLLGTSIESEEGFNFVRSILATLPVKLLMWAMLSALIYHVFAGLRHLVMDLGFWESLGGGKLSARLMMVISGVFILLAGVWLW